MSLLGADNDRYALVCGNNRDYYERVGAVNAVITDPPYGAEVHRKERHFRDAEGQIGQIAVPFDALDGMDMSALADFADAQCSGWMLTFCQAEQLLEWQDQATASGIRYVTPMVWIKPDAKPNFSGAGPESASSPSPRFGAATVRNGGTVVARSAPSRMCAAGARARVIPPKSPFRS